MMVRTDSYSYTYNSNTELTSSIRHSFAFDEFDVDVFGQGNVRVVDEEDFVVAFDGRGESHSARDREHLLEVHLRTIGIVVAFERDGCRLSSA